MVDAPALVVEAPRRRLHVHPRIVDAVLVIGSAAILCIDRILQTTGSVSAPTTVAVQPAVLSIVVSILVPQALWWRRSHPARVHIITLVGVLLLLVAIPPTPGQTQDNGLLLVFATIYSIAAYDPVPRRRWVGLALALVASPIFAVTRVSTAGGLLSDSDEGSMRVTIGYLDGYWSWQGTLITTGVLVLSFVFGRAADLRRSYARELGLRLEAAEATRVAEARTAVVAERNRIAQELHDVVAHHVSVMTIQAAAAQRVFASDPASAVSAMGAVEHTGRAALRELRSLVGSLRVDDDDEHHDRLPVPRLEDMGALIEAVRVAGLPVDYVVTGQPHDVGSQVELAAYRIVQESLTNVLRHAGPTTAEVSLTWSPTDLTVRVRDRGNGVGIATHGGGHGLTGMKERAARVGGELTAGPRPGAGFEVLARLPRGGNGE